MNDICLLEKPTVKENQNMESSTNQGQNNYWQVTLKWIFGDHMCSYLDIALQSLYAFYA
jgi:hypothetical protein